MTIVILLNLEVHIKLSVSNQITKTIELIKRAQELLFKTMTFQNHPVMIIKISKGFEFSLVKSATGIS